LLRQFAQQPTRRSFLSLSTYKREGPPIAPYLSVKQLISLPETRLTRALSAEWKADPEAAMTRLFEGLPCAPSLAQAQRVTPFMGMMEYPNLHRGVSKPGLALVGDAALSIDPLWGIGCGWALQSAEWLAGSVGRAWMSPTDLDRGLSAYAKRHRSELADHRFLIENFSTGRPFNVIERLTFSAAARDPVCADAFAAFGSRFIGVGRFLRPDVGARVVGERPPRAQRRKDMTSGAQLQRLGVFCASSCFLNAERRLFRCRA